MIFIVTAQQWAKFDHWANYTLPATYLIAGVIFLFVGLLPILFIRNKWTISLFSITSLFLIGFSIYAHYENQKAKNYFKQTSYITAQTREYEMQVFSEKPYDPSEISAWQTVADVSGPSKLTSIYKRYPVKQKIIYLGRDDYFVYVELDKTIMRFNVSDCAQIAGNQAYFSGYAFKMKDKAFRNLGFINLTHYYRDKVLIPKDQWNKKIDNNLTKNYNRPGLVANWIPESSK